MEKQNGIGGIPHPTHGKEGFIYEEKQQIPQLFLEIEVPKDPESHVEKPDLNENHEFHLDLDLGFVQISLPCTT